MTDEVDNLVLEQLRAIRAGGADVRRDVRDIKTRLSSLENQVVQMHKSVAFIHEDLAGVQRRAIRPAERLPPAPTIRLHARVRAGA